MAEGEIQKDEVRKEIDVCLFVCLFMLFASLLQWIATINNLAYDTSHTQVLYFSGRGQAP